MHTTANELFTLHHNGDYSGTVELRYHGEPPLSVQIDGTAFFDLCVRVVAPKMQGRLEQLIDELKP